MNKTATAIAAFLVISSSASLFAQATPAAGQKVFETQKCSLCHSIAGKGNPKGELDGIGTSLKPEEIRSWLKDPVAMAAKIGATRKPPMRSFANLPPADFEALVAYLSSLKQ